MSQVKSNDLAEPQQDKVSPDSKGGLGAKERRPRGRRPGPQGPHPWMQGEKNPSAKLSPLQVEEIRKLYGQPGHSYRSLAKQFGVSPGTIRNVVMLHTWATDEELSRPVATIDKQGRVQFTGVGRKDKSAKVSPDLNAGGELSPDEVLAMFNAKRPG